MRHPLRSVPAIARKRRRTPVGDLLLAIPRLDPEREFATLRALMKPQEGRALQHQLSDGQQPWPPDAGQTVACIAELSRELLGHDPRFILPLDGEYRLLARFSPVDQPAAIALAMLLSVQLPGLWITVGRFFVRQGKVFRRERGIKLKLTPATDVHLPRPLRASYQQVIRRLAVP